MGSKEERPLSHSRVNALFRDKVITPEEAARLLTSSMNVDEMPRWVLIPLCLLIGFIVGEMRAASEISKVICW